MYKSNTAEYGFRWLTKNCRGKAINQWLFFSRQSPAVAAEKLNEYACRMNFRDPSNLANPPKGTTLQDWVVKNSAPMWACLSAIDLCLLSGWIPASASDWAMYAFFLTKKVKSKVLSDYTNVIDHRLDNMTALGWIVAAIESSSR